MSHPSTDPYRAYYDFDPVYRNFPKRGVPGSRGATVRHELGRAGSPCDDLERGTKVDIRCPECGATGRAVDWHGRNDFYACPNCETVLSIAS